MKVNVQVIFKGGNSLQGDMDVENFQSFCDEIANSTLDDTMKTFEIQGEFKQTIIIDMHSVASMVVSEKVEEPKDMDSAAQADMDDMLR